MRLCQGPGCTISIEGRRPQARYCTNQCGHRARHAAMRLHRIREAIALRPRCMICSAPIRYGRFGVTYRSATCGNLRCVRARRDWFVKRVSA